MWQKKYKDYPEDTDLVKKKVEPGKGIVGCEMHEINGWGLTHHQYRRRKNLFVKLFTKQNEE